MASLDTRLAHIERHHGTVSQRQAETAENAVIVDKKLVDLACRFDDTDAAIDPSTQLHWSVAQRVAWMMRFAPQRVVPTIREYLA